MISLWLIINPVNILEVVAGTDSLTHSLREPGGPIFAHSAQRSQCTIRLPPAGTVSTHILVLFLLPAIGPPALCWPRKSLTTSEHLFDVMTPPLTNFLSFPCDYPHRDLLSLSEIFPVAPRPESRCKRSRNALPTGNLTAKMGLSAVSCGSLCARAFKK